MWKGFTLTLYANTSFRNTGNLQQSADSSMVIYFNPHANHFRKFCLNSFLVWKWTALRSVIAGVTAGSWILRYQMKGLHEGGNTSWKKWNERIFLFAFWGKLVSFKLFYLQSNLGTSIWCLRALSLKTGTVCLKMSEAVVINFKKDYILKDNWSNWIKALLLFIQNTAWVRCVIKTSFQHCG